MNIPVLIQAVPGKGFVARAGSPFDWTAEGATEDEALANLQAAAMKCIIAGCNIASIDIPLMSDPLALAKAKGMVIEPPHGNHPLLKWAGTHDPNDPVIQEWKRLMQENRASRDVDDATAEVP